ncbi:MAG: VWA domain-containing protein [Candidatus Hodarchaeota archaeon]
MAEREFDIEDTVILMDVSRSMVRKDFEPCRIEAVKNALIEWIKLKHNIDKADRFALITFSTNGQVVQDYTDDLEQIISAIKNVRVHGISALGEGMGFAVQFIGQKMAKAGDSASGGNVNRILIISDGKASLSSIDPIERANVAAELGIITDCIEISKLETRSFGKLLESMAILGEFYNIYDKSLLEVTIKSLSHKKDVFELKKTMPNLSLIAADLLDLTSLSEEMQKAVNKLMGVKVNFCEICRSNNCPVDGTTECIRLCPYCKTGMHIHCAEEWAKQSKMIEGGVCRCPHCLFLLKLPPTEKTPIKPAPKIKATPTEPMASQTSQPTKPTTPQQDEQAAMNTAATAKVGDFILENDKVKLKIKHRGEEKFIYLAWDNWGKENYSCNIISGMSDLVCKEFHPKINWTQGNCTGFIIRDLIGWFSSTSVQHGVFIYNLNEFEQWNKTVLKDISNIKKLSAEHPEIKFSSDKIMDFLLEAEVKFAEPLEVSDRNSLEGNLLLGAMTYLNLFESAITPLKKIKEAKKPKKVPAAPTKEGVVVAKKPTSQPPKPKSELAKRLEKLDKIPISILAEKLGMSNIKVEGIIIKLIDSGELEGTIKKGIFYRKKS